jgi:hypothetical protein
MKMRSLESMGLPVTEVDWAAVGGGLGSFIWVDLLRICGVKTDRNCGFGHGKPALRPLPASVPEFSNSAAGTPTIEF